MNKTCKKVTAVLPARNCRAELDKCIAALRGGSCPPELIVIDDASVDGTAEMIREKWPSAVLLRTPVHTGFAHAANLGLRLVQTEYALLIRPGLQPGRTCVGRLLEALDRPVPGTENAFCAVPGFRPDPGRGAKRGRKARGGTGTGPACTGISGKATLENQADMEMRGETRMRPRQILAVPDGCALYRMADLEETGWLDERHFDGLEALDLSLRASLDGLTALQVPGAYVRPFDGRIMAAGKGNVYGVRMDTFRRQLAAANGIYVLYKHMSAAQRALCVPRLAAANAAQKAAFAKAGETAAYQMAVDRGRALCGLDRERRAALRDGVSVWAESLPDAAYLGMEEEADRIYPMYLAQKEEPSLRDFPARILFQARLFRSLPEILRLFR